MSLATIVTKLLANNVSSGALVLLVGGTLVAALRKLPGNIWWRIRDRIILRVRVSNDDEAYEWIERWVGSQPMARVTRNLRLVSRPAEGGPEDVDEDGPSTWHLGPGNGEHLIRYHGSWVWLSIEEDKAQSSNKLFIRTQTLRMFRGSRPLMERLIAEAREDFRQRTRGLQKVFTGARYTNWQLSTALPPRSPESLVLADGIYEAVRDDLQRFYAREDWYRRMGIPWRRGFLLEGPPGNGKSSLVKVVAGALRRHVAVLSLASKDLDDLQIMAMLAGVPEGAVVVLEDIDAAFKGREGEGKLSFSGLLNALDGIGAPEGRVVFMTTNHKDALDPALIRPGRADVHVRISDATTEQAARFFRRFFPDARSDLVGRFAQSAAGRSMAAIQEHCMRHEGDAEAASRMPETDAVSTVALAS